MKLTLEEIEKIADLKNHSLNLSGSIYSPRELTLTDIHLICNYLRDNPDITTLKLRSNNIRVEGIKALATNIAVTTLYIGVNDIGAEGAQALAANTNLTSIDVVNSNIGAAGAIALAANTTLTSLDIGLNNIGTEGAKALAANTTLKTLSIWNNNIGVEGAKALAMNTTLTTLNICNNKMNDEGMHVFTNTLKSNTTLLRLRHDFSDKQIQSTINKILMRNKINPWLMTARYARLLAQAHRTEDCCLGKLPVEILGVINDYTVGTNHFSFFLRQFDKRPTNQDFIAIKQLALS